MSSSKKTPNVVQEIAVDTVDVSTDTALATPNPLPVSPQERISEDDMKAIELAKARLETANAQAREAAARAETAQIAYRYMILQVYLKYGMNQNDVLSEQGAIVRGGAVQQR